MSLCYTNQYVDPGLTCQIRCVDSGSGSEGSKDLHRFTWEVHKRIRGKDSPWRLSISMDFDRFQEISMDFMSNSCRVLEISMDFMSISRDFELSFGSKTRFAGFSGPGKTSGYQWPRPDRGQDLDESVIMSTFIRAE